jgi:hypothetical protein
MKSGVAAVALILVTLRAPAEEPLRPGYRVGDRIGHLVCESVVTGPDAGKRVSLVCKHHKRPTVMVFAREVNGPVVQLIRRIDRATGDHTKARLGSYVVLVGAGGTPGARLKALAAKEKIRHTVLAFFALDEAASRYGNEGARRLRSRLGKQALVTVVLTRDLRVRGSYAYRQGELDAAAIGQIMSGLAQILPKER